MTTRNPYVLLGIPFGSSRNDANIAFARKAKQLRALGAQGRSQMTDLTWALNQIDEGIAHPEAEMEIYRIPADPNAFTPARTGVLAPPPQPLPARPGDAGEARAQLQAAAAHEYLRYVVELRADQVTPQP